jgi:integrase
LWFRKKVPLRLRALVGRTEVWLSLETLDRHVAAVRCIELSAALEADWARLVAEAEAADAQRPTDEPTGASGDGPALDVPDAPAPAPVVGHLDLHALRKVAHLHLRDRILSRPTPPTGFAAIRLLAHDDEALRDEARDLLQRDGSVFTEGDVDRLMPLLAAARADAVGDARRAVVDGDFSPNPILARLPERAPRVKPELDLIEAFETYVANGHLKGGAGGPTATRWRPKIHAFADFIGHRDLARMTTAEGYRWMHYLKALTKEIEVRGADGKKEKRTVAAHSLKSIRDVWIASLSATASYAVETQVLETNPFRGIKVRGVVEGKSDEEKSFTPEQAEIILTATLAGRSHLISRETWAARRWIPWICAYTGARVNEITSLLPSDIELVDGIQCLMIKAQMAKTEKDRKVPLHPHLLEQGFMTYVEERRNAGLPLFYDPARRRGGKAGNPQYHKVGERLAEWVHTLGVYGVAPSHGWRHLFKSVSRHIEMNADIESFITGHSTGKTSAKYGSRWTRTLLKEISKYPRFKIKALKEAPAPHVKTRRTPDQIAADDAAKAARKAARATRAA